LFAPPIVEGGRLCESWFWRAVATVLLGDIVRPAICPPVRPADKLLVFIVRTGIWAAAAAGAVRATTERFSTDAGGIRRAVVFAAPNELWRVGLNDVWLLTSAPRKDASVTCAVPRLIACPPTKALREATVTAFVLWA
jgi:hypothetical protein